MSSTHIYDHSTGVRTVVIDNGDGTGTRTVYAPDGTVTSTEELTDLPIPEEPPPDPVDELRAQVGAQQALIDDLLAALGGGNG